MIKKTLMLIIILTPTTLLAQKMPKGFLVDSDNSIRCAILQSGLTCEIDNTVWQPDKAEPDDCEFDRIKILSMDINGVPAGGWLCTSDTWMHEGIKPLAMGKNWQAKGYQCERHKARLLCRNKAGHGWSIGKKSIKLF